MRRVAGRNRVEKTRDVSLFSTGPQVDMTLTSLRAAFALQQLTPSNARPSTPLGGYSDWTVLGHVTTPWTNACGQGIGYANRLQPIAALLEADRCLGSPTQAHRCLQKDLRRPSVCSKLGPLCVTLDESRHPSGSRSAYLRAAFHLDSSQQRQPLLTLSVCFCPDSCLLSYVLLWTSIVPSGKGVGPLWDQRA